MCWKLRGIYIWQCASKQAAVNWYLVSESVSYIYHHGHICLLIHIAFLLCTGWSIKWAFSVWTIQYTCENFLETMLTGVTEFAEIVKILCSVFISVYNSCLLAVTGSAISCLNEHGSLSTASLWNSVKYSPYHSNHWAAKLNILTAVDVSHVTYSQ